MKKYKLGLTLALTSALLVSCQCVVIPEDEISHYSLEANIKADNVWKTEPVQSGRIYSRGFSDTDPLFVIYFFNSTDQAFYNYANTMDKVSSSHTFDSQITEPGTYTLYGITNALKPEVPSLSGTPKPVVTSANTFILSSTSAPNDVCLGSTQLTVTASQHSYTSTITVSHIMSQLALTVKSVPSDVTSMSVTLPKQANVFDFSGTFSTDTTSQSLALAKSTTANTDGTYNWTSPATIVFPSATGTTSMPINITWGSSSVSSKKVSTTSSTCCTSGKNLSLSTTWNENFSSSTAITTASWSAVEEGTFSW